MALPVGGVSGLSDVVESLAPDAVVLAGGHVADDDVALWAYRVRAAAGPLPMALYRRQHQGAKIRATGTRILPAAPFAAHRQLLALIDDRRTTRVHDVAALTVLDGEVLREAQA
jgi:MerR family transcriptional regulator, light-induced transcriptional regulator